MEFLNWVAKHPWISLIGLCIIFAGIREIIFAIRANNITIIKKEKEDDDL